MTETVTIRKTFAQPYWRAYNASQVHEREYVERLLTALCACLAQRARTPGRGRKPPPIADLVFAVVVKSLSYVLAVARRDVTRMHSYNSSTPSDRFVI